MVENEENCALTSNTRRNYRVLVGFWILGLCNNYGYVVMLSAAYDILKTDFNEDQVETRVNETDSTKRVCNELSTGTVLLANIVPSMVIKLIVPFLPLFIHLRIILAIIIAATGYVLVAVKSAHWLVILGVVCQSFSSGLGEASLLPYMSYYQDQSVITSWSSGTGGAGLFGSISYAGLISIGLSPATTIYLMLSIPVLMGISFWLIITHPEVQSHNEDQSTTVSDVYYQPDDVWNFRAKLKLILHLIPVYMFPFALVYFFEYFINQGLFELINADGMAKEAMYRWYNFAYQVGVFISRSSMYVFQVDHLWILAVLQFFNLVVMMLEAIFAFFTNAGIIFAMILWEGLLGGCSYVNTFRRISAEMHPQHREFSMAIVSFSDSIAITMAGLIAIPVHNIICNLPAPKV